MCDKNAQGDPRVDNCGETNRRHMELTTGLSRSAAKEEWPLFHRIFDASQLAVSLTVSASTLAVALGDDCCSIGVGGMTGGARSMYGQRSQRETAGRKLWIYRLITLRYGLDCGWNGLVTRRMSVSAESRSGKRTTET